MVSACRYVQVEAGELSLMLRKSVEARDWLATVEPRSVRAVMKRIVEDVTIIGKYTGVFRYFFRNGALS